MLPSFKKILLEPWTPASVRPVLWLEARRRDTLFQTITSTTPAAADSDVVGTWRDLSGLNNNIVATGNDTTRPTLQGSTAFPTIRFDGTNDRLLKTGGLGLFANGSCSIFAAVKGNTPGVGTTLVSEANAAGGNSFYSFITDSTTNTSAAATVRNDAGTFQLNSSPIVTGAFSADAIVSRIDTGSSMSLYVDKGAVSAASYTRTGVYSLDNFALCSLARTTASGWWAGDVYGLVIVKGALGDGDRLRMISYLAKLQGRAI